MFDKNCFVVTGSLRSGSKDKCEKYLINENKWVELPSLNKTRDTHSSCYFESGSECAVYVFGGFSEDDDGRSN